MWQYIITGIIVLAAVIYTVYRLVRYLTYPLRKHRDCSAGCSGCEATFFSDL
ncbi:MAG: FeoB-associated Cys-rich membrane protein [Bacteroidales bacterium]|nr:FeoB-associated Cys-rich membrane protein [Bacteroidales bacterium]